MILKNKWMIGSMCEITKNVGFRNADNKIYHDIQFKRYKAFKLKEVMLSLSSFAWY